MFKQLWIIICMRHSSTRSMKDWEIDIFYLNNLFFFVGDFIDCNHIRIFVGICFTMSHFFSKCQPSTLHYYYMNAASLFSKYLHSFIGFVCVCVCVVCSIATYSIIQYCFSDILSHSYMKTSIWLFPKNQWQSWMCEHI